MVLSRISSPHFRPLPNISHTVFTDETDPKKLYKDSNVYASNLKWVPVGSQKDWLPCVAEALYPDILIAKMLPGHEIDLRCLCFKGLLLFCDVNTGLEYCYFQKEYAEDIILYNYCTIQFVFYERKVYLTGYLKRHNIIFMKEQLFYIQPFQNVSVYQSCRLFYSVGTF